MDESRVEAVKREGAGVEEGAMPGTLVDSVVWLATTPWFTSLENDLEKVRRMANLLDSRYSVMGFRFGADSVIGLIPGIGDLLTSALATYPLLVARHHKLGRWVQFRMGVNVAVDALFGVIPVVGDVFDVVFKANRKNLRLLEAAVERRRRKR